MINRDIKKQIDDVLDLENDSNHYSMITDSGTKNGIKFCNIAKISELNQMSLILSTTLQGYRRTEAMNRISPKKNPAKVPYDTRYLHSASRYSTAQRTLLSRVDADG